MTTTRPTGYGTLTRTNDMDRNETYNTHIAPLEGRLRRYAATLEYDKSLAEDLLQDTLLRALEKIDQKDGNDGWLTWLKTIMYNLRTDKLRSVDALDVPDNVSLSALVDEAGNESIMDEHIEYFYADEEYDDEAEALWYCVERYLSEEDATLFKLSYSNGYTAKELADIYDVEHDAMRQRLARLTKRVKGIVRRHT